MSEIYVNNLPYNAQRFLDIQPRQCVIGSANGCIDVFVHDNRYILLKVNDKYKEKNDETLYNTIGDFLTTHKLVPIPVEIMDVPVQDTYGHPDITYLASIQTPNGK